MDACKKVVTLCVALAAIVFSASMAAAEVTAKKPNVVVIMTDDMGMECITAHGGESYQTSRIDQLAAEGMRFDHAFSNPICTPSRVKIMTGMSNVRNYVRFGKLDRNQRTFAHQLKEAGYATAIVGKWQLGNEADGPEHFGFDQAALWQHTVPGRTRPGSNFDSRYVNPILTINGEVRHFEDGEYGPDICADFAMNFMAENAKQDQPFLVYYPMILPHWPFDPTPASEAWDPQRKGSETARGPGGERERQNHFGDMVNYTDRIVGRIVDKLEALGIRDNTLIIFTGDNGNDHTLVSTWKGRTIQGGKGEINDRGVRVPFIASWPKVIEAGTASEALVDFSDILPTLCEAAGAPLPQGRPTDGVSLMPTFKGKSTRDKPYVYIWNAPLGRNGHAMARTVEHIVVRSIGTSGGTYFHSTGPYDWEQVPLDKLTNEQREFRDKLIGVMDDFAKTRGSQIGH